MQPASSKVYTVELETIQLDTEKAQQEIPPYTTPWHILLACLLVLVPITVVTTLLIMFVSWARWTLYDPDYTRPDLPIARLDSSSFNTVVFASKVILVSSWSSNIAQFATAPFMLIFSFLVARDLASRPKLAGAENEDEKGLLQRNNYNLLKWLSGGQHRSTGQECIGRNATRIAGYGALISLFLTYVMVSGHFMLD